MTVEIDKIVFEDKIIIDRHGHEITQHALEYDTETSSPKPKIENKVVSKPHSRPPVSFIELSLPPGDRDDDDEDENA